MTIRIGISGWRYAPWRGDFYPKGLAQRRELEFASRHFPAIEINGTFYSLQRATLFRQWYAETPDEFRFAVKGGRFITHMKRLSGVETPLANFFASGVLCLRDKLGPILWQLPARQKFDRSRIDEFLGLLPRDTRAAATLAKGHDGRPKEPDWPADEPIRPLRHALEVRHPSFETDAFVDLLRQHNVALVSADSVEWPLVGDVTADFVYVRLHGSEELYASGYNEEALQSWARSVRAWHSGRTPRKPRSISKERPARRKRDVYVFFDNDMKVRAPYDARRLMEILS